MAQKIYGVNDIAQEDDFVRYVVTDDATPEYLDNIDGKAYFSYDDSKVTIDEQVLTLQNTALLY